MGAQASSSAGDHYCFSQSDPSRFLHRLKGHSHRTGQQRRANWVDTLGRLDQTVFGKGHVLGEPAVAAVADACTLAAAVLVSAGAAVAIAASLGEDADHPVPLPQPGDLVAGLCHHARYLVAQDHAGLNAAA